MPGQPVYDATAKAQARGAAVADLTSAAGTPAAGTVDVGAAFNQANINNNFATLVSKINALQAQLRNAGVISN